MKVTKTMKFPLGRVENFVGKGEKAGDIFFLIIPRIFLEQKMIYHRYF